MKLAEKWQKDLAVYSDINTTFIIEGNVHDRQPWIYEEDGSCEPVPLSQFLHRYLTEIGYSPVIFYNRIDGFSNPYDMGMAEAFFEETGTEEKNVKTIGCATEAIRNSLLSAIRPSAVIIDMANTIATSPDNLSDEETEYFTRLMLASKAQTQALSMKDKRPLTNLLFLIVEKVNDIPPWFYLNNPYVRTLTIGKPEKDIRAAVVDSRIDTLAGVADLGDEERAAAVDEFASLTDGMTLVELFGIFSLCRRKGYGADRIRDAVKLFRYGETESHWDKLNPEKVKETEEFLSRRVKGQKVAVTKATEILSRACLGLTGIQGGSSGRPKGVLFLAGPTGTGKTELAKTIAEFVFGDESFVTRFDMSEYQQPHSDQKLIGAPPGYVGYSEGGQLTNAVKTKPFSVLLFDEIDKAHPSVLDKFLQILEDGRMTDSAGETVYFSESLIIFTSNLGMVGQDPKTGERFQTVTQDMKYEQIRRTILGAIKDYFKFTIGRPELLNRIGDNFVVFDFIREDAAEQILELKLKAVVGNVEREKGIQLVIGEEFKKYLLSAATGDLSNGGRGISNLVETELINPLSKILVQTGCQSGSVLTIREKPAATGEPPVYTIS